MTKGIVPFSPITSGIMNPEEFIRACGVPQTVVEKWSIVQNLLLKLQIGEAIVFVGCIYHFIDNAFDGYKTKFGGFTVKVTKS